MSNENFKVNLKTRLKRVPKRGVTNKEEVYNILDSGFVCQVGFIHGNHPVVIPTLYGRSQNCIYIHGSSMSRMLVNLEKGIDVSINVCLVDGLVLARSAFHHSMNYRSVVIFGNAKLITSKQEKISALKTISENVIKGRWEEVRIPSDKELKGTKVLKIELNEVSAKVRTGPPVDENKDYELDIWAGVLPFKTITLTPEPDPKLKADIVTPKSVLNFQN